MPVSKASFGSHAAPVASTSATESTAPSARPHFSRPQSPLKHSLPTRSPSTDDAPAGARRSTSFRSAADAAPRASTSQSRHPQTPRNVLTNDTNEAQFHPLVGEITNHDDRYVYVTHGTRLANVNGIFEHGLDPAKGGGKLGAATYEGATNSDSLGNLKYAHDPNVSLKYANAPAEKASDAEAGVQLEARIDRQTFLQQYDPAAAKGETKPFWRPEQGGENNPARMNDEAYANSMGPMMPHIAGTNPPARIWSSESNVPVRPEDVRVIGVSVPPGQSVETSGLKTEYGD
jgi:hypothetical protein